MDCSKPFNYQYDYNYSNSNSSSFWNQVARKYVSWNKIYDSVYSENENGIGEWFKGGQLNTCYNALDIHLNDQQFKNEIALVHVCSSKNIAYEITYQELYTKVCIFTRALKNLGIVKGDTVVIYMHNCIELVIAMLACSRLGAVHCVVFGGYQSKSLAERIDHCKPKLLISSNYGFIIDKLTQYTPLVIKALELSTHKPESIILLNRNDIIDDCVSNCPTISGSLDWYGLVKNLEPCYEYEVLDSNHPLYILYTSGTTGKPKGIVRESGGHAVAINYAIRNCYGLKKGDTFFTTANIGWVSGHSFVVYGCLFAGVKSIILEDLTLDIATQYWNIVSKYKVNASATVPAIIRIMKKVDPDGSIISKFNVESHSNIFLGGDKSHATITDYIINTLKQSVTEEYWQTESGWGMLMYMDPLRNHIKYKQGSAGKPLPGYNIVIINSKGEEEKSNRIGEICVKLPLPPCFITTLYKDHELFCKKYTSKYPSYYNSGDNGYFDDEGYFYITSRVDNSLSIYGSMITEESIENSINKNTLVNECAVIGVDDQIKGQIPLAFIILNKQLGTSEQFDILQFENNINRQIMEDLTVIAIVKNAIILNQLPKTRTGKVTKSLLREIFNGQVYNIPPSLNDTQVVDDLLKQYEIYKSLSINNKNNNLT